MANICSIFSNILLCKSNTKLLRDRVRILKDRHETITFEFLLRRSEQGIAYYQTDLSNCYLFGLFDTPIDTERGLYWLRKAVGGNDRMAIHNMATLLKEGKIVKQDYKKAIKLYKKSAKLGLSRSWNDLGVLFEELNNNKKAELSYKKAVTCDSNNFQALENLGVIRTFKLKGKQIQGVNNFIELIDKGSIRGYIHYAYCLYNGIGIKQDFIKSAETLIELKEKLNSVTEEITEEEIKKINQSINYLATRFHILYEEAKNDSDKNDLFHKVGRIYDLPSIFYDWLKNSTEAFLGFDVFYAKVSSKIYTPFLWEIKSRISRWPLSEIKETTKGAENDNPDEICYLGCLYLFGREDYNGKKGTKEEAFKLFQKSAAMGYGAARYWMAICLEEGIGVEKDESQSIELYQLILTDYKIEQSWENSITYRENVPNKLIIDSAYRLGKLLYHSGERQDEGRSILVGLMKNYSHHFAALELCKIAISKDYSIPKTDFNRDTILENLRILGSNGVGEAFRLLAIENEKDGNSQEAINNYILAFKHGHLDVVSELKRLNF